ncbi:MAG: DUF5698 domain-containing protein [Bacteroidota bacterium]
MTEFLNSDFFAWIILPILIFSARIVDQSAGTLRVIFASKGFKKITPILAFIESFIWLVAISQIMKRLDNWACYVAYSGGYAMGNFVGILLDEKLSIGTAVIRVIPKKDSSEVIACLRSLNYGITSVDAEVMSNKTTEGDVVVGKTKMFFTTVKRKDIKKVICVINKYNPNAFYTVEEVRAVKDGYFISAERKKMFSVLNPFWKKGK